jgi:hypothetical protein
MGRDDSTARTGLAPSFVPQSPTRATLLRPVLGLGTSVSEYLAMRSAVIWMPLIIIISFVFIHTKYNKERLNNRLAHG